MKITFSTIRNQVEKTVYFNATGSVQRYQIFPPVLDGWGVQRNVAYIAPGVDATWFTSDDVVGSKDDMSYSPTHQLTHRNSYQGSDPSSVTVLYEYDANGNLTKETFQSRDVSTYGVTGSSYNASGSLDLQVRYVNSCADGTWGTADDAIGTYTRFEYDPGGMIMGEVTYQLITPEGTVLPAEEVVGYVYYLYDAQGRLGNKITYESPGSDGIWFNADDPVSLYWEYAYNTNGQLIAVASYGGVRAADGVWFTGDYTLLAYILYSYDASGNRTQAVRYNNAGPDNTWFTADDVPSVIDTYDTLR
jgi:YD repeat-containing protein